MFLRRLAFALVLFFVSASVRAEFRGAWVATVHNLDWPSRPGLSAAAQQAELRAILDRARSLKLSAILFQVRPMSDALYASETEPWSQFLTGKQGQSPGYDPLAFAIREAHARGLELHAWINPFRAASNARATLSAQHVARRHPEWVRRYGAQLWLDPGEPAARAYVLGIFEDIVRRYDLDGVHIDDYFYPYPLKGGAAFPDDASWQRFGLTSGLSRADWRRENINDFVRSMYRRVKTLKPGVLVGISPFGIWRPGVPAGTTAQLDPFAHLFADSRKWLAEGWCDYLAPQLYWNIEGEQSFPLLLDWWREQSPGKPVWPGLAVDRIGRTRPCTGDRSPNSAEPPRDRAPGAHLLEHEGAYAKSRRDRRSPARRGLRRLTRLQQKLRQGEIGRPGDFQITLVVRHEEDGMAEGLKRGDFVGDREPASAHRFVGAQEERALEDLRRLHREDAFARDAFAHEMLRVDPL